MENSQPLATESFSYSWLVHKNPSSDNYLIKFPEICTKEENFKFDFPVSASSPIALVHADEILSDGYIMPTYVKRSRNEGFTTSTSAPCTPLSSYSTRIQCELLSEGALEMKLPGVSASTKYFFLRKWRKLSKRVLQKCFGFVRPLRNLGFSRKSIRVDDLDRKVSEVQSWSNSLQESPRPSRAYSSVDWAHNNYYYVQKKIESQRNSPRVSPQISSSSSCNVSADIESSISEAILYCKRSIGTSQ